MSLTEKLILYKFLLEEKFKLEIVFDYADYLKLPDNYLEQIKNQLDEVSKAIKELKKMMENNNASNN